MHIHRKHRHVTGSKVEFSLDKCDKRTLPLGPEAVKLQAELCLAVVGCGEISMLLQEVNEALHGSII